MTGCPSLKNLREGHPLLEDLAPLRRGFLFDLGTLARFAPRLAELHFRVRLRRVGEHALNHRIAAAGNFLLAVVV